MSRTPRTPKRRKLDPATSSDVVSTPTTLRRSTRRSRVSLTADTGVDELGGVKSGESHNGKGATGSLQRGTPGRTGRDHEVTLLTDSIGGGEADDARGETLQSGKVKTRSSRRATPKQTGRDRETTSLMDDTGAEEDGHAHPKETQNKKVKTRSVQRGTLQKAASNLGVSSPSGKRSKRQRGAENHEDVEDNFVAHEETGASPTPQSGRQLRNERESSGKLQDHSSNRNRKQPKAEAFGDKFQHRRQISPEPPSGRRLSKDQKAPAVSSPIKMTHRHRINRRPSPDVFEERVEVRDRPQDLQESSVIQSLRRIVLSKLTSRRPTSLKHLDSARTQVHQLLASTITAGQGNSLLLLGSRGSGKSALVADVLNELACDQNNVGSDGKPTFHTINLNGAIHTDDKLALREIWRQLGREMEVDEDDEGKPRNYADTLASLLALLSHPTEIDTAGIPTAANKAEDEKLSNAVIFVISEFDAFAARSRQTLLYNLFDVAQSRKAPIAVLGLSTRMDVAEMLEKRVKSRFSHRYVHIPAPKSFDHFLDVCLSAISVGTDELSYSERQQLESHSSSALGLWNQAAVELLDSEAMRSQLEQIYAATRSIPAAFTALHLPIATLDPASQSVLNSASFPIPTARLTSPKLSHLSSLPTLALALLIAAARLPLLTDSELVSFALAYDEYRSLATKARLAASSGGAQVHGGVAGRVWGKGVARTAWESLCDANLIMPEDSSDIVGTGLCRVDVALEEVEPAVITAGGELESTVRKWCREL